MACFINLWYVRRINKFCVCVNFTIFSEFLKGFHGLKITWKTISYLKLSFFILLFFPSMAFMKSICYLSSFPISIVFLPSFSLLSFLYWKLLCLQNFRAGGNLEITYFCFLIEWMRKQRPKARWMSGPRPQF